MKFPVFALLCALNLTACAQATSETPAKSDKASDASAPAGPKDAVATNALKQLSPKIQVDWIGAAPIPGFREAVIGGQTVYVSDDGRYMLQGSLYDIQNKEDLSQKGISILRRAELKKIPESDRIVFAPQGQVKHTVAVFTDIECAYCRKLHSEIAEYNKRGIAVEYLAFPRAGLGSPDALAMESVWCSDDRRKALTDAKKGAPVAPKRCENPVATEYKLGQRLGLTGTPMIINADGIALPGYLPPEQLLKQLDELAAHSKKDAAQSGTAAGGM